MNPTIPETIFGAILGIASWAVVIWLFLQSKRQGGQLATFFFFKIFFVYESYELDVSHLILKLLKKVLDFFGKIWYNLYRK